MSDKDFYTVDYVLFALSLALSLGIGVWAAFTGGKQKTTSEYLMGNRDLNPLAVGMSIFMSFISAILVLGNVAEVYLYGIQWWLQLWGDIICYFYVIIICVPFFYRMKLTSSFEYLEKRFQPHGKLVRYTGDFLQVLFQVLYMGTSLYAPSIALNGAIGFPEWATILISGCVATIYTTMGGMKAVVWTDLVQGFIYMAGVLTILIIGTEKAGGIVNVWETSKEYQRTEMFIFDLNPATRLTFWSIVIGTYVSSTQVVGVGQTSVQRYCAVNSLKKAKFTVLMLIPAIFTMITLTCFMGLVIFAYYANEGCDPLRTGEIDNPNSLLPVFLVDVIDIPGLGGLFLSVLFSGALSTLSSSISSLAAVTWTDLLEHRFPNMEEGKKTFITKLLSVFFGMAGVAAAFLISNLEGPIAQASMGLVSGVAGPLLGMFLLGMFVPWANGPSTAGSAFVGLALVLWCAIGNYSKNPYQSYPETEVANCTLPVSEIPEDLDVLPLYKISFMWYSSIGCGVTMLVGTIMSFITGPTNPRTLNPNLTVPMFDKLFCCLPASWRKKLHCGVDYDQPEEEIYDMKASTTPIKDDLHKNGTNTHTDTHNSGGYSNTGYVPYTGSRDL